jgi:SAM-dependent methyltransferase
MNKGHLEYLASAAWAEALRTELLPWLEQVGDLGDDVLEIGPGPGLTTDLLRARVRAVTAIEIDQDLARQLAIRLADPNVSVVLGDATTLRLEPDRYSAATCFSMLHHMPSPAAQDLLFSQLGRALRPGGILVGVDSVDTERIRLAHVDDVFVPLDPGPLPERLERAGLIDATVTRWGEYQVRFHARKPE